MEKVTYQVLLVEDSTPNRKLIQRIFRDMEDCKLEITEAIHGKEALEILEKKKVEMVITDMRMPVMGGLELIQKIRQIPKLRHIPILLLTVDENKETKLKAFELGATDYLSKPFLAPELKARTLGFLGRERAFQDLQFVEKALRSSYEMIKKQQLEMKIDLEMAEEVQKKIFTYTPPPFLKIALRYAPCSHVSGDVYHFQEKRDGSFELFLGGGTGHGIAAGLTTVMANMILKEEVGQTSLQETFFHLNASFEEHLPDDRFMSAILAQISPDGFLKTVNAGHLPLFILPQGEEKILSLKGKGLLLGLMPNDFVSYEEREYSLQPGDRGFLLTDGITERMNQQEKLFGEKRLLHFFEEHFSEDLETILSKLLDHLDDFSGGVSPEDDVSIVAFEYIA